MEELGILSKCAQPSYKSMSSRPNEESVGNVLDREFQVDEEMSVLVSDLTSVKVGQHWNYVRFLIDLHIKSIKELERKSPTL